MEGRPGMSSGMTTELLRKSVPKVLFVVAVGVTSQKGRYRIDKDIRKRMCETPHGMQNGKQVSPYTLSNLIS